MSWLTGSPLFVVLPLGFFGLVTWGIWLYRRTLSHHAKPYRNDHRETVSVVVPVFGEDPVILSQCLDSWLANDPDEILLVVDTADRAALTMLAARQLPDTVQVIRFQHRGKRSALGVGIRRAQFDVVVLVDSDTAWEPNLISELVMGFEDPAVGGVGTRQLVAATHTSIWRRVASWLLDIRFLDYVPAMGFRGAVPCLSGRTVGYRRSVVLPLLDDLEHEIFMGRECVAGDDGRLTWLTLAAGYKTVYQRTAIGHSMFPGTLRGFILQRVRWTRNSCRCYVTAIRQGWLWRQPLITQVTALQILLTPITMGLALTFLYLSILNHRPTVALLFIAWVFVGRALRGLSHLQENPKDIVILPVIVLVTIVLALPIKLFSFFTMGRQGWLTRSANQVGGEGQDAASLSGQVVLS